MESEPMSAAAAQPTDARVPRRRPSYAAVALALVVLLVVGTADYLTGHEILFSIFYLVPVAIAAWYVGPGFAITIAVLSVGAWLLGDVAAGAAYSHPFVPVWNFVITLGFYFVVVVLLRRIRGMQEELEARVRQRTTELTEEIQERQRLELEILETGELERRRIGRDLHDTLGQLLTGTALAGQVLREKLGARDLSEAAEATRLVSLVEEAIELTRNLSRGLDPIEVEGGGLAQGLHDIAARTSALSGVRCEFRSSGDLTVRDRSAATHLYRIAQEAVTNALRHSRAGFIRVQLDGEPRHLRLAVIDDGIGIPDARRRGTGMGLRIMAHRAAMIGGTFEARSGPHGGTTVECRVPNP